MEEAEAAAEQQQRRRRAGAERSPSPGRLDVSSSRFDPLLALYSARTPLPFPGAPCFNNLAEYESFQRGLLRPRGRRPNAAAARRGPSARSARRGPAAADPERIQRLRSLMVNAGPEQEAAAGGAAAARRRRAPRNVLTRMPRKGWGVWGEVWGCQEWGA